MNKMDKEKKTWIITGGAGFLGHSVVEHFLRVTNDNIIIIDKLSYATRGLEKLRSFGALSNPRVKIFTIDLVNKISDGVAYEIGQNVNYIVHLAAESHVDMSIKDPVNFINNNIQSTLNILEFARSLPNLEKFVYWSTDEIFGPAPIGTSYKEDDRQNPTNPYSASKSAGEMICIAYANTYKLKVLITNCMNIIGERQHVEKWVPKIIKSVLDGNELQIHCDSNNNPGSRSYIHARNCADALLFIVNNGNIGERYNITGELEVDNLEIALMIGRIMGKEVKYKLVNFHKDRPGHDIRYALDGSKLAKMGWKPPVGFEESLRRIVNWTLKNLEWLEE